MTARSWIRRLFARTPRTVRKAPARFRPRVEALEDRTVPALYTVTNALDDGSVGSLRWAINQANATPVADIINFSSSLAGATISLTQVGDLFGALVGNPSAFAITGALTISGPTASSGGITIGRDGAAPLMRLFHVYPGAELALENLTLTGGVARGGDGYLGGGGGAGMGGAIFNNQATLRLDNVTLADNAAIGGNGGAALPNREQIGGGFGGGPNGGPGGQQYGINLQYDTPLSSDSGGHGGFGGGGGAAGNAGGPFSTIVGNGGWGGFGGGGGAPSWVYYAPTFTSSRINEFSAPGFGGFGGGNAGYWGDDSSLRGSAWGGGGAGMGGAIFNFFGTTILNGSTLSGNSARGGGSPGGGVYNPHDGQGLGGAVFNMNGDFRATNSTIAENAAWAYADTNDFSRRGGSRGGAVYNLNGRLSFLNSTIAANRAAGAGGIASLGTGLEVLTFGVLVPANSASIDLTNTLVAEAPAVVSAGSGRWYQRVTFGPAVALDTAFGGFSTATARNSLATSASASVAGLTISGDLRLGPLGDNGGPTRTMALLPGSPAINAGDNSRVPAGVATDQRGTGFDRVVGSAVDVGAFEVQPRPPVDTRTLTRDQAAVTGNEGSPATNTGTFDDPDGRAGVTLTASLGMVTKNDDAGTWSSSYTPADGPDGPTTVTITATVGGVPTVSTTFTLTVANVAPTIEISGAATVNEGATYTLTLGPVTDPGTDTVTQYIVDWGDGTTDTYTTGGAKTHVYADGSETWDISVDLIDEDGTHIGRGNPFSVTVNDVAPTIAISGAAGLNEGATYTLTLGTVADPGSDTVTHYIVNWGDGTSDTYTTSGAKTHVYADGPATRAITVDLIDEDGTHTNRANALSVTVNNVAPTVTLTGPPTGSIYAIGTPVTFTGQFTDAGTLDTHTAQWIFDTTAVEGTVSESNGSGSVSATYTFSAPGVYAVKLIVRDNDNGEGVADTVGGLTALVIAYDSSAGFVTGGGWINSPAGAYAANPSLTGKANFGFVSKYHNGNTVPSGNTEFQFKVADFNFKSTAYEWLVVSGAKARFRGTGTVNGVSGYGFELTAWDGQANGGGGTDRFRIKIWNRNQGNGVVYDNQMGAADGADPTTALGGGSIVIHRQGQPLMAANGPAAAPPAATPLTDAALRPIVDAAIGRWAAAGLDAASLAKLRSAVVIITDLGGSYMGMAYPELDLIQIDDDAAGHGWFVDPTPLDDSEFATPGDQGEQGRADLVSVVAHELGHLLGLDDLAGPEHEDDVMGEALTTGTRRVPAPADMSAAAATARADRVSRPSAERQGSAGEPLNLLWMAGPRIGGRGRDLFIGGAGTDTLSITVSGGSLSTSGSVAITVKSAAEQAADLRARVESLRVAGVLNMGQANRLIKDLSVRGNAGDVGKVQQFLLDVDRQRFDRVLTQAQADELMAWGNILMLCVSRR
jgi:hypothetical protein